MTLKHKLSTIVPSAVILGCATLLSGYLVVRGTNSQQLAASIQPQVKEIENYRAWTKVNPEPQLMPVVVATACMMLRPGAAVMVDGADNPHRDKYFVVYVNNVGRKSMLDSQKPAFPEGSVIVKEKLPAKDSSTPDLLTVMIKQKPGFDPPAGDWEYMVVNGNGTGVQGRGRLPNCQGCHAVDKNSDYVFRSYLPRP